MRRGERVRWYVIGLGNDNDIHTLTGTGTLCCMAVHALTRST
jgi:hypothetical protein